jgi:uncharacterized membrane protein YciS (DUF1049 family)
MKIKLAISLALAFFAFIFITQNTDLVQVDFLVWSLEMSLVLLLVIMLGSGIIIGWLLNSYLRFVRNRRKPMTKSVVQSSQRNPEDMKRDQEARTSKT